MRSSRWQGRADRPDGSHAEHGGKLGRVRSALHRLVVRQHLPVHGRRGTEALDVWLAAYRTKKPAPSWPFGMWQYTSKARVPGVSTNVDMSHAYKDYAGIISKKGLTRLREGK